MIKTVPLIIITLFLLIPFSTAFAESNVVIREGGSNVNVSVKSNINSSSSTVVEKNSSSNIHISTNGGGNNSVQVNNDDFKISGTISSVSSESFEVSGQKIYNDSNKFSDYKLEGSLEVGKEVTVEGKVINGDLYARLINTSGSSSAPTPSPTPQNSPTPSPSPSPTQETSPSPSQSPNPSPDEEATPSSSPNLGPIISEINDVIKTLQGIVKLLDNLF